MLNITTMKKAFVFLACIIIIIIIIRSTRKCTTPAVRVVAYT